MRKLLILLGLVLLVLPAVMAAECIKAQGLVINRLQARYSFYHYRSEVRNVEMTAVIDHGDDLGKNTTELDSIRDEFVARYEEAQAAGDAGNVKSFNTVVSEGKLLIKSFRETAREMFNESEKQGVRAVINNSLESYADYLSELREQAIGAGKVHRLTSFDARVCVFQRFIVKVEGKGYVMDEYQLRLDALAARRTELITALDAANEACDLPVFACNETEAETFRGLVDELNQVFRELKRDIMSARLNQVALKRIEVMDIRIERISSLLDRMEERHHNVSEHRDSLESIDTLVNEASVLAEAGNNDAAMEKINQAIEGLNELMRGLKAQSQSSKGGGGK
jgi:hypothetical protein